MIGVPFFPGGVGGENFSLVRILFLVESGDGSLLVLGMSLEVRPGSFRLDFLVRLVFSRFPLAFMLL